jgi:zinc protease
MSEAALRPLGGIERVEVGESVALLVQDPSLPMVRFAFALRYGAWADPKGRAGATQVLLELMSRGTRGRSRLAFYDALEGMGSSLSVTVGDEVAVVRGVCLKRFLEPTMELLLELLTQPALDAEELSLLVEECQEELRNDRDDDDELAAYFLRRELFRGHAMGRDPAGTVASLGELSPAEMGELFSRRFHASHHVWFFGGDWDREVVLRTVERAGEALSGEAFALKPAPLEAPAGPRILVVDKPDRSQVQTRIAAPTTHASMEDSDLIWLGAVAFGGTFTSPFTREVRDVRGWSYFASAGYRRRRRNTASLILSTATATEDVVDCLELQLSMFNQLAREAISVEEINRARSYLLNRYPFTIATPAEMLLPVLQNELVGQPATEIYDFAGRLESFDPARVQEAMIRNLAPERYVGVLVGTASRLESDLRGRFPNAEITVVDYKDGL